MVVDAAVSLRNQRKQTLSQYLSDTCRPSAIAGVKKDLQLILQTHLQGVQNADHKARWDEVYLIKKKRGTAPEVTGNYSEEEIAFDCVIS